MSPSCKKEHMNSRLKHGQPRLFSSLCRHPNLTTPLFGKPGLSQGRPNPSPPLVSSELALDASSVPALSQSAAIKITWQRPSGHDCFKMNVDAALDPGSKSVGVGAIIRESHDDVYAALKKRLEGRLLPKDAELIIALLRSLQWAQAIIYASYGKCRI
ncbi:hypothetical protein PanWU01x14_035840 [Parasponia andersonii]|uniref:RNase H type-1 domain-containing protein n=1 Tax=Parasponia andersonii TaxID=3476 RepID=A0A2P5DSA1_PARAD|nr:hypothetical protein PanWU01x14_035840 [Parasponia andersonii]